MHQPATRVVTRWRLIPFLLLAAVLHVLAIIILPQPRVGLLAPNPVLEVHLAPVVQPPDIHTPLPSADIKPAPAARRISPKSPPAPSEVQLRQEPATAPPQISVESLMSSARRVARDEARHTPPSKKETPGIEDRPVLPALAKALTRAPASETQFANGIYKVVTKSGTVYCYIPLPDIATSGTPVKPTIVPSTCP